MNLLLDSLLDRQKESWLSGSRPSVDDLIHGSSLREDPEALLDLVYNEIVVRDELGETPMPEEYILRFPHLRNEIELQFEVHRAVQDRLLVETEHLSELAPVASPVQAEVVTKGADYEILHPLGRGGMGVVYKARHSILRRFVALKMFHPGFLPSPRDLQRFQSEAEAVARLQHPNIVQVFEVGQMEGKPFLALELAEGGTLSQRLQLLPFAPRAAAELIETLARAAHHAHKNQIIHRDLKPANVLFSADGTPKLTDFGLAKILEEDRESPRDATRSGEPIGTPRYMSPEQAAGRLSEIGPRTDVYALGTLLYECLTGSVPFMATSVTETLDRIRFEEPVSPRCRQSAIPKDLATICLRCLEKQPYRRYLSAEAMADDLRNYLDGKPIAARPTAIWEKGWKWCKRRPAHAALIAIVLCLLAGGFATAAIRNHREQQRLEQVRMTVEHLMAQGHNELVRQDYEVAQTRFRDAWVMVQGEPTLSDYRTGISGWLDHCRRATEQQHWKGRVLPRQYDDWREEALLLCARPALVPSPSDVHDAVAMAVDFTVPGDSAWDAERERLAILDAEIILHETGDTSKALARLGMGTETSSRLFHNRRAQYLDRLQRTTDSAQERCLALLQPPLPQVEALFAGIDQLHTGRPRDAITTFEGMLEAEPEHYPARLLLASALMEEQRHAEAKVALTACIAQRPSFVWNHVLRGDSRKALGDFDGARSDWQKALDLKPQNPARPAVLQRLNQKLTPLEVKR